MKGNILHPREASRLPCSDDRNHRSRQGGGGEGRPRPGTRVAGQRLSCPGRLTQRRKGLLRKRAGRSELARRPLACAGPVRKSRSRSVCFPAGATSFSTALLNSRPGSGARLAVGGQAGILCHRPGACERPLLPRLVLSQAPRPRLQTHADKTSRGWPSPRPSGKDSRLLPSGLSVTVLISFPARRGLLTSRTQMKTLSQTPDRQLHILAGGGLAPGSVQPIGGGRGGTGEQEVRIEIIL